MSRPGSGSKSGATIKQESLANVLMDDEKVSDSQWTSLDAGRIVRRARDFIETEYS